MLANSVKNQTKQIFQNIEILFENIQENEFDTIKGGFKTWKHIYHLIHSLDKNFIDPSNYEEPIFHKKNMNIKSKENHLEIYWLKICDDEMEKENLLPYSMREIIKNIKNKEYGIKYISEVE